MVMELLITRETLTISLSLINHNTFLRKISLELMSGGSFYVAGILLIAV